MLLQLLSWLLSLTSPSVIQPRFPFTPHSFFSLDFKQQWRKLILAIFLNEIWLVPDSLLSPVPRITWSEKQVFPPLSLRLSRLSGACGVCYCSLPQPDISTHTSLVICVQALSGFLTSQENAWQAWQNQSPKEVTVSAVVKSMPFEEVSQERSLPTYLIRHTLQFLWSSG